MMTFDRIYKMKRFKVLKKCICVLGLMVLMVRSTFALGPGDSHVKKNVAVIGDSYAGYFMLSESNIGFDFYTFPVGGITNEVNINSFLNCIENGNNDIIVFMTGVNDYLKNTSLKDYENTLKLFVERAKAKNKFILLHTYMDFPAAAKHKGRGEISDYDNIHKEFAHDFVNVLYIDMSAYNKSKYYMGDGMHYNSDFYDALYEQIKVVTDALDVMIYGINVQNDGSRVIPGKVMDSTS